AGLRKNGLGVDRQKSGARDHRCANDKVPSCGLHEFDLEWQEPDKRRAGLERARPARSEAVVYPQVPSVDDLEAGAVIFVSRRRSAPRMLRPSSLTWSWGVTAHRAVRSNVVNGSM